jgi:flavin reductase (DIM6/NTAB) family NADH-FMN oxidoreductase RutF
VSFEELVADLDYPMFIATVSGDGCLIGFATQCSIDPPRFLACLSNKNRTYRLACETDHMAVHVVPAERRDLADLFGGETGDEVDKLARCSWREGPGGVPLLDGCPWLVGRILERFEVGDHVAFELGVLDASGTTAEPLRFQQVRRIDPGHEA